MEQPRLNSTEVERLAADQILEKGVRMQLRAPFLFRLFGKRTVGLTVRAPYIGTMIRVSRLYLNTGITDDKLNDISHEEAHALMAVHGVSISKAVACAWLNGYFLGWLFTKLLARYIRNHATAKELMVVTTMLLIYGGVSDFINTTRSVRDMKMTAPMKGQKTQGS